jgi:multiple sugar transport system permease protein
MSTMLGNLARSGQRVSAEPSRRKRKHGLSGWHFVLLPLSLLFLVPFLQMVLSAFAPEKELVGFPPPFWPSHFTVAGFAELFGSTDILRWLLNSAIVSVVAIISNTVLCSLAGYGFARLKFAGRDVGFFAIIATIMIPTQLLMIPTYVMFAKLGLLNGLGAAIVPWLATAFGIFLMRQFFLSIPAELEEAGMIDGCSRAQVFFLIVLPLARPALATLAIFTLLDAWNDLVWPLIAINNPNAFTVQLGIANFQGMHHTDWSLIMAGNVIATAPLILFFLFAQRQFIATMTLSGLKG